MQMIVSPFQSEQCLERKVQRTFYQGLILIEL